MRQNIVLIDFENVQPDSVAALAQDHFRVLVFVGANQTKVPFETAASVQQLGFRAEYIKITGNGSNALDFHIAYYIGKLSALDPTAYFHIVSKDTGFDPLIAHLKNNKIFAGRVKEVADIPVIKLATKKTPAERVEIVLEKLRQPKATRPRTVKTLSSTVASYFQKQLSDDEVAAVIEGMVKAGAIYVAGSKVTYAASGEA
jgi:hypothetical protein